MMRLLVMVFVNHLSEKWLKKKIIIANFRLKNDQEALILSKVLKMSKVLVEMS